jgi:predicted HAD superfamily Cof-like phosphohydrolase
MDKVNAKMVREAEAEFNAYCKKHGDWGKVQVALENTWLELKKAYAIRKAEIRQRFLNDDVVKFYESDNHMSYAAFNILHNDVWQLVAEVVIAHEDGNEKDLESALHYAADEKRIKLGKLVGLLK